MLIVSHSGNSIIYNNYIEIKYTKKLEKRFESKRDKTSKVCSIRYTCKSRRQFMVTAAVTQSKYDWCD